MSEFEQFFKNSKIRKLQVLCAITFGGIVTHLKVIAAFKLQKIMFFEGFDKALFWTFKNSPTMTFRCVAIKTNSYGAQYLKFSILKIFEKMLEFARINENG